MLKADIIRRSLFQNASSINEHCNLGAKLEEDVYKKVLEMKEFDMILSERELVSKYGWQSSSIDHLLIRGNFIIPIQLKWRRTRRRETLAIENFIKSIHYVKEMLQKEVLFGVWSSRMKPFDDNVVWLKTERIIPISFFDDIDGLVEATINTIEKQIQECK